MDTAMTRREAFKLGFAAIGSASVLSAAMPREALADTEVMTGGSISVQRIWGQNALDTMHELYDSVPMEAGFSSAVICTNTDWHDALSAAGLAGHHDAMILMTSPKKLSSQTKKLLDRFKPSLVFFIGSTLSDAVVKTVSRMDFVKETRRIKASGHIECAYKIAEALISDGGAPDTCIITRSDDYADALSIASVAYMHRHPVLFSAWKPADTLIDHIRNCGYRHAIIMGGEQALSSDVARAVQEHCDTVTRIAGKNAVETSTKVWEYLSRRAVTALTSPSIFVATRNGYKDALTAAPICATYQAPLLLVTPKNRSSIKATLDSSSDYWTPSYTIIGGAKAVPNTTTDWIFDYWNKKRK